jgi:hypothetical protein
MITTLIFSAALFASSNLAREKGTPSEYTADQSVSLYPVDLPAGEDENVPGETRLRFPDFTVIIRNFKGYESVSSDFGKGYQCNFNYCDTSDAYLTYEETEPNYYKEIMNVRKDTIHLSEDLDNRINNTQFEIIPAHTGDRFKISFYYEAGLNEIIDYRNLSHEEAQRQYDNALRFAETTRSVNLPDSANYFFTALPHTPDMVAVTVEHGELVYAHSNTPEQINAEAEFYLNELETIKQKYQLRDTLVEIPGEYMTIATLTGNGKNYNYHYNAYVFRIDRYQGRKIVDSKYIHIGIAYGC